jgi:hypothetical protein
MAAAALFVAWMWFTIGRMSPQATRDHACREDPGQATSDVAVLSAAVASLGAVGLFLAGGPSGSGSGGGSGGSGGSGVVVEALLTVLSVALAWATVHTVFTTRLDDLQQRVATARSAVQEAAAESDAQLKERIDRAQADLDQSVQKARQEVSEAADTARAKWAQLKADAAAKRNEVKANIDKRNSHVDAKVAAKDADWAEADAADALDFADWAVESAQLAILDAIHARAYADRLAEADTLAKASDR